MKKNLIIFLCGMIFAAAFFFAVKKLYNHPLLAKVVSKAKDWQFNRTPKAATEKTICDFEELEDLNQWNLKKTTAKLSDQHCSHGNLCAEVNFQTGAEVAAFKLKDYFGKPKAIKDWSGYQSIAFNIFNPQEQQERIIVQIKDSKDGGMKADIYIEPQSWGSGEIEISGLRHKLDISHIEELTFFLWEPNQEKTFYIDDVRLVPYGEKNKQTILSKDLLESPDIAYATGDYFDFTKNQEKWLKTDGANASWVEFPFFLVNSTQADFPELPFTGGVPFPKGELKGAENLEILDDQGKPAEFQTKPLARWQDGSIKWLLVDLNARLNANSTLMFKVRYADHIKRQSRTSELKITEDSDKITVKTGPLQFTVKKHSFNLWDKVWLDKNDDGIFQDAELINEKNDLTVQFKGKIYLSSQGKDSKVTVEDKGPVKSTIKAEGWFVDSRGKRFCKYVVRIQSFAGSSCLRVYHTFIYTGYPENKYHYLYRGKRLPKNETVEAIEIYLPLMPTDSQQFTFEADNKVMQAEFTQDTDFYQGNFNLFSVEQNSEKIHTGNKLAGWLDLSNAGRGITVFVKSFWQQFPKEFFLDKKHNRLVISLWPKKAGALDLKTTGAAYGPDEIARGSAFGLAKTHELIFYFHSRDYKAAKVKNTISGFKQPLLLRTDPLWVSDTVAIGKVLPFDQRLLSAENTLEDLFSWGRSQRDNFSWYGMLDFGDTLSWYRNVETGGPDGEWGWHPVGRWGWMNCEGVGTHTGILLQYLRTGKIKYLEFGGDMTRHIMDVDTCHYNTVANDKRLKRRIFEQYSQVGSTHRHNGNHWGGRNDEASHTNLNGILLYYYITGYERAFDVAKEIGEYFLKEPITYFRHPDVAPIRTVANILWGEVDLYQATQDERYKQAADKWADILYKGQHNNGSWTENYNPVAKRWDGDPHIGFMEGYVLPALIEYHKLTRNRAIKESILKLTQYLMKNDEYSHQFEGISYSFWLTGKRKFYDEGAKRLDHFIAHQNHGEDPLMNGMIYQKAYYMRLVDFLYRTPFIFEVLAYPVQKERVR